VELILSGLASGFDWKSLVDQLADVQRAPQRRLRSQQVSLGGVSSALSSLSTELTNLKSKADALKTAKDSTSLKTAINEFVEQYNKTQRVIEIQTASSTDSKGAVTPGILADQSGVSEIARSMRSKMVADVAGVSDTLQRLESLGYSSEGFDNEIVLNNPSALDAALQADFSGVQNLFAGSGGIGTRLSNYLETVVGDEGSLSRQRDGVLNEATDMDDQIRSMEESVQSSRAQSISKFQAMEKALAQVNRQSQFFAQRFGRL